MCAYWQMAYFDPQPPHDINALPIQTKSILDWTWNRTAVARWVIGDLDHPLAAVSDGTKLAIFNWQVDAENRQESAFKCLRSSRPDLPILLVVPDRMRDPLWQRVLGGDQHAQIVRLSHLEERSIQGIFDKLGVSLPAPKISLYNLAPGDFAAAELVRLLGGRDRLRLALEKFFPDAGSAEVRSISGGWSGSKLCLVYIDGGDEPYFFKFFGRRDEYETELTKHQEAQKWLDDKLVRLHPIDGLGSDVSNQRQAFPETAPGEIRGIVCYESASTRSCPRCTLKDVYRNHNTARVTQGIQTCLEILASKQKNDYATESPWREDRFTLEEKTKATILAVMHDLTPYGPAMCADWKQCCESVGQFVHGVLPPWLLLPLPVMLGHTHGDPNPRNCLVLPTDCANFRFIDIGGYSSQGRLVSDLAIIERDIKLVLMGIEEPARHYHDLDVKDMCNWYYAEREALRHGIDYLPAHAPAAGTTHSLCHQAYEQVALVRQRAKQVCGNADPEGKHYFAALLFWTLDILRYEAVRPTKKLLAICSAAETLQRF